MFSQADIQLAKKLMKAMALLVVVMLFCGRTQGFGAAVLAVIAFVCAMAGKISWAIIPHILFPFFIVMNPHLLPKSGIMGLVLRFGPMITTLGLMISSGTRRGKHQIPLGGFMVYLLFAGISSIGGYFPMISYLKIVNFLIMIFGLWIGFRNIHHRPEDIITIRMFLLALTSFVVWGSVALLIFAPGMAYMNTFSIMNEFGLEEASRVIAQQSGMTLFSGITNQSQCLGVILPMSMAWLMCDMFFVEERLSKVHVVTILTGLPLLWMTRSRAAFVTAVVAVVFVYFYGLKRVNISQRVRGHLRNAMTLAFVAIAIAACVMEARNHSISRWLRKTEESEYDSRGLTEAFTSSRMGKVQENMADFHKNPVLGTGFQVTEDMKYRYRGKDGLILSAPLEKGVLPLMVLGETGIVGFTVFVFVMLAFYSTCARKHYYCTLILMSVLLATNLAEATFFSPGGVGGPMWMIGVGGGFIIDTIVMIRNNAKRFAAEEYAALMRWEQQQQSSM